MSDTSGSKQEVIEENKRAIKEAREELRRIRETLSRSESTSADARKVLRRAGYL